MANHSLARSSDSESKDKNFVSSLDRFAKTAVLWDSILTHVHVHPY